MPLLDPQSLSGCPQSLLEVTLTLTSDGTDYSVPCSQIKQVFVDLKSWGFDAEVEFCTSPHQLEDSLFAAFTAPPLIEAALSVTNARLPSGATCDPIAVSGIVTHKECVEYTAKAAVSGKPIMHRRYRIRFGDAARVLWSQHYPCELHVDTALKDVIDAQKGAKITITHDWAAELDATRPHVFLPLGAPGNEASFYEFLVWYTATRNGVLTYDSKLDSYKLSGAKDEAGSASSLAFTEVGPVRLEFPETPRAAAVVLNSSIAIAAKKDATPANDNAFAGVRRDFLVRMPAQGDVDARATLEANRLTTPGHEAVVEFAVYPTTTVLPGTLVNFSHPAFGTTSFTASKDYRVRELTLRAMCSDQEPTPADTAPAAFVTRVVARLELKAEKWVPRPGFRAPRWPARVEGTIVSEEGAEDEETWQAYTDSDTSLDRYKVAVPLFKESADVFVYAPFDPNGMPGHLFFPAYKGAQVLLSFELFSVTIHKFIDWRGGGRLPADGQGNHILVGKTATNRTSVSHVYEDQKPVLLVSRLNDTDTQTIELKDGTITICTKEDE